MQKPQNLFLHADFYFQTHAIDIYIIMMHEIAVIRLGCDSFIHLTYKEVSSRGFVGLHNVHAFDSQSSQLFSATHLIIVCDSTLIMI